MYIKEEVNNTIIIEKSKFITYLRPCFNEEEYKTFLKEIKKKHYDATHVCSAFISENVKRSSDDGEPSGTAGVPILSSLEKAGLTNTCALVVRYFGGVKLGAGGLVRAYSSSVSDAIKCAKLVEDVELPEYEIVLDYDIANKVDFLLMKEAEEVYKEYDEKVKFNYLSDNEKLIDKILEITSGIKPTLIGKQIIQKDVVK